MNKTAIIRILGAVGILASTGLSAIGDEPRIERDRSIELGPDDKPAFAEPPADSTCRATGISHESSR